MRCQDKFASANPKQMLVSGLWELLLREGRRFWMSRAQPDQAFAHPRQPRYPRPFCVFEKNTYGSLKLQPYYVETFLTQGRYGPKTVWFHDANQSQTFTLGNTDTNIIEFKTKVHATFSPCSSFSPVHLVITPMVNTAFRMKRAFPIPPPFSQFNLALIPKQCSLPCGCNSEDTESQSRDNSKWEQKPEVRPGAIALTLFEAKRPAPWTAASAQAH